MLQSRARRNTLEGSLRAAPSCPHQCAPMRPVRLNCCTRVRRSAGPQVCVCVCTGLCFHQRVPVCGTVKALDVYRVSACPYRLSILFSIHCAFLAPDRICTVNPHLRTCTESVPVEVLRIFGCCVQHLFHVFGSAGKRPLSYWYPPPLTPTCTPSHYLLSFTSTPLPVANVTWSRRFSRPSIGLG